MAGIQGLQQDVSGTFILQGAAWQMDIIPFQNRILRLRGFNRVFPAEPCAVWAA